MTPSGHKILLVDDEKDILEFISYNLRKEGYEVITARNGKDGIDLARNHNPHLILLDVMMPEMDGIETCEEIRKLPGQGNTIIAFLTARGEDYSQIAGFEAGGDDYIIKPIKPKVLISRIKALLKRYEQSHVESDEPEESIVEYNNLVLDRERFLVVNEGKELTLPKKEFELLSLLLSRPDKVFTREEIFRRVWGDDIIVGDRTIDVHIRKLREKIGEDHIRTVKGVGYKFVKQNKRD
ncbi:MAG: response regulator transcription factor [Bacteroidales bacterium]|nr:MAG: response regulator transcription factor [Bacteroidales bacterium]